MDFKGERNGAKPYSTSTLTALEQNYSFCSK